MLEPVLTNPWVRAAGALAALLLVMFLLYLLSPILIPLFFAFLVAYVLDPVVDFFERKNISRTGSIAGLAISGIVLLISVPLFIIPSIIDQADSLASQAKERSSATQSKGFLDGIVERLPLESLAESLELGDPEDEDYDPLTELTIYFTEQVKERGVEMLTGNADQIAQAGGSAGNRIFGFFASVGRGAMGVILFLGNLALFSFVSVYLLKDYDAIISGANDLIPLKYREKVVSISGKINLQVRGFLRGQMLVCVCLGVMYAIGLSIAGVPFALLIAVFGAFASFIPYLGLVLTIGPAIVLCLLQYSGVDWHVFAVIATFVIAQMLEGTVLTPKIVGEQVGLGPVWVILAIMVFGNALGFLGLLLAVPIAASLKVLVVEGVDYYRKSPIFTDS